jgi:hypothetical protein
VEEEKSREDLTGLLTDILRREAEIKEVEEQIKALPARIPFPDAHEGKNLVQQNYEKKRFLDCIKVFVYNMEKQLCSVLLKYFGRWKYGLYSAFPNKFFSIFEKKYPRRIKKPPEVKECLPCSSPGGRSERQSVCQKALKTAIPENKLLLV